MARTVFPEIVPQGFGAVGLLYELDASQLSPVNVISLSVGRPAVLDKLTIDVIFAIQRARQQIAASRTLRHTVDDRVAVTEGIDFLAPVDNGIAAVAIGTASVSLFSASSSLVRKRHSRMHVTAVPAVEVRLALGGADHVAVVRPHLCPDEHAVAGKGRGRPVDAGCHALVDLEVDGDGPEFLARLELSESPLLLRVFRIDFVAVVQRPSANRDRSQDELALLRNAAGTIDCKHYIIGRGVKAVARLETGGDAHMIEFPLAHAVEVELGGHRLHARSVARHDVDVVHRPEQHPVSVGVMGDYLDRCGLAGGYLDVALDTRFVALLIANGELDAVAAGAQSRRAVHADDPPRVGGGDLVAVDVGLGARGIDARCVALRRVVAYSRRKIDRVARNGGAVLQNRRIGHPARRVLRVAENRSLAIVDDARVVNGHIVDVHREVAIDVVLVLEVVVVFRTVAVRDVKLETVAIARETDSSVFADVHRNVVPSRFAERGHDARCPVFPVVKLPGLIFVELPLSIFVFRGCDVENPTSPQADVVVGDVHPHADGLGILYNPIARKAQRRHLISGLQAVGVVDVQRQRILAAMYLPIFRRCDADAASWEVIVVAIVGELHAVAFTILEVEKGLRALTERQLRRRRHRRIQREVGLDRRGGNLGIVASFDVQTVDSRCGRITQRESEVTCLRCDGDRIVGCRDADRGRRPVGDRDLLAVERDGRRDDHVDGRRPHGLPVVICRYRALASRIARSEDAVLKGAASRHVSHVGGNVNLIAGERGSRNRHLRCRTRRNVLTFG